MRRTAIFIASFAVCLLFVGLNRSFADQWIFPAEMKLKSPNGLLSAVISIGTGETFKDFDVPKQNFAAAKITGPNGEVTVFPLLNPVHPVDALLLDSGDLVTFDNWHRMGFGYVIAVYSKTGAIKWRYKLETLLSKDRLRRVSHSASSRWWRKKDPAVDNEEGYPRILITLWNEDKLNLNLTNGSVQYVEIADLGDDAASYLSRGRDLYGRNEYENAVRTLRRAIELDSHLIEAYRELSSVYNRQENYKAAIDLLLDGVRLNPADLPASNTGWDTKDQRLWLMVYLGEAYENAAMFQEAADVYLKCLAIEPAFWGAANELAQVWYKSHREEEADRLLEKSFNLLKGDPISLNGNSKVDIAAWHVGQWYMNKGLYKKAIKYYEIADRESDFYIINAEYLAECYEKAGDYPKALRCFEKIRAWKAKEKAFADDLPKLDEKIDKLKSKLKN